MAVASTRGSMRSGIFESGIDSCSTLRPNDGNIIFRSSCTWVHFVDSPSVLRGNLFPLSGPSWPFTDPFRVFSNPLESLRGPPSRPLADPSRASSNPLVALRRSSWPFVDIFLSFVPLRGSPSWISFFLRVHSCPFLVLPAPSWIPSSIIVITFHHFEACALLRTP